MSDEPETTAERAARLRREGVILCGPTPTEADLDAVEAFRDQLRQRTAHHDQEDPTDD